MTIQQSRSRRKISGGRYKTYRKKRLFDLGNDATLTKIGEKRVMVKRVRGARYKISTLSNNTANVYDPKDKKYKKATISTVVDNPANKNYIRRNIITKGTIIETDLGKARVTNRPGQEGSINAILI